MSVVSVDRYPVNAEFPSKLAPIVACIKAPLQFGLLSRRQLWLAPLILSSLKACACDTFSLSLFPDTVLELSESRKHR